MYYLLLNDAVKNYLENPKPLRDTHLDSARKTFHRGEPLLGGAFADTVDGAALAFEREDPSVAERFAGNDSNSVNRLVQNGRAREWNLVVGGERR